MKERWGWTWDVLWVLLWLALASVWCISSATQMSATFDEPFYIQEGLTAWRTGSFHGLLKKGTMPLPAHVHALPLYIIESWTGKPWDIESDFHQMLPWFRAGNLVFFVILIIYGSLLARQLAGPWAGRVAVVLLACEPNFLGHASLGTTDIAITGCLLALIYHFRVGRDRSWFWRVGLPMFWFTASVLAKASGVVFGPICLLILEIERQWKTLPDPETPTLWSRVRQRFGQLWEDCKPYVKESFVLFGGGMVLVFLYCGSDWRPLGSFQKWAGKLPEGQTKEAMVWASSNVRIFSNAGEGILRQVKHNMKGHDTFILGESSRKALWYYFPVLLTIKLPWVTLLALLVVALLRPRSLGNSALLLASVLVVFSLSCRVQIGIRLVFPLVALLEIGLVVAAVRSLSELSDKPLTLRAGRALTAYALLWLVVAGIRIWPHGLCYVNEFWGGTEKGYLLVSDSNYDWGQGLPQLRAWQRDKGVEVDVWYFGKDPALPSPGLKKLALHNLPIERPEDVPNHLTSKYLAVGMSAMYSHGLSKAQQKASRFLREQEPVGRTQTFLIFETESLRQASRARTTAEHAKR